MSVTGVAMVHSSSELSHAKAKANCLLFAFAAFTSKGGKGEGGKGGKGKQKLSRHGANPKARKCNEICLHLVSHKQWLD